MSMDREQFWHILKTELSYQSPGKRRFLVENVPGWPMVFFYYKLAMCVLANNLLIRQGKYNTSRWADASFDVIKIVESVGGRLSLTGLKGVTKHGGPVVYIANHMSMLDTLILPCVAMAFGHVTFVVKEELLNYPFFGAIVKAIPPIAIKRRNPREDLKTVLEKGTGCLDRGTSVIIFPQATRSPVFDPGSFNSLGVKLARKAGVPVVPVALKTDFQCNGQIFKDIGMIDPHKTIYAKFGEPEAVEGNSQAIHRGITKFIAENLRKWGAEIRGVPNPSEK